MIALPVLRRTLSEGFFLVALMIPFCVIMCEESSNSFSRLVLGKENQSVKAFGFHGSEESFQVFGLRGPELRADHQAIAHWNPECRSGRNAVLQSEQSNKTGSTKMFIVRERFRDSRSLH